MIWRIKGRSLEITRMKEDKKEWEVNSSHSFLSTIVSSGENFSL